MAAHRAAWCCALRAASCVSQHQLLAAPAFPSLCSQPHPSLLGGRMEPHEQGWVTPPAAPTQRTQELGFLEAELNTSGWGREGVWLPGAVQTLSSPALPCS